MRLKKLLVVVLGLSISIGCTVPSFATSPAKCIKTLKLNKNYYYDVDGNGKKDKLKFQRSKDALVLWVNKKNIKLKSHYTGDEELTLYDFNKKDKTLDFLWTDYKGENTNHRILKFKNSKCVVNKKLPPEVWMNKYDNKNGKVTFIAYHGYSQVNYFCKSTGYFFDVYPNDVEINFKPYTYMTVNKYKVNISTTFNTSKKDKKVSFETKRKLRAYKSISDILHKESNNYEWTISKGVDVNIINLYMKDGKYYIKFRIWLDEYNGKPYNKYDYGYIKVGSTRLFKAVK